MPAPLTGQAVCTGPNNPIPLANTQVIVQGFVVKAPATNTAQVAIGASNVTLTTGHLLDPGETFTYQRNTELTNRYELKPSDLYVAGTSGDVVSWLGSP